MMSDYEKELTELEGTSSNLQQEIRSAENHKEGVQQWLALIKECTAFDELDRATAF